MEYKVKTNTDKRVCRELASLLVAHGVHRVFISPGSRNAPIIVAMARTPELTIHVVVDERVSAFMAMGYASVSGQPVAVVCTSGTALLNFAPAVAEAYYRRVPLIVITADRPMEWIDQDDSQTLRQSGALANYTKLSCDIPELTTPNLTWYANRKINDAILAALTGRKAPVHINIQLDAPLGNTAIVRPSDVRVVRVAEPCPELAASTLDSLASRLAPPRRVMVIAGFNPPDQALESALNRLAEHDNVVVMTETISNLHGPRFISAIDTTLTTLSDLQKAAMAPDVVITVGGALVSRFIKEYMRRVRPSEHWHIGVSHTTIDCFQSLTLRVEMDPAPFFTQIEARLQGDNNEGDYYESWEEVAAAAAKRRNAYISRIPWSDYKAFSVLMDKIPAEWNLQFSNGTPIRYAQLFGDRGHHRYDCNRGVSGIDGCTATAIGASMAADRVTLLISGDTSAQYDIGALAYATGKPNFKMIVICNGGGGIFRFIKATSELPELEQYFCTELNLPLKGLAEAYGIAYFEATDSESLSRRLRRFIKESKRPALLCINTPPQESASVLKQYFINM